MHFFCHKKNLHTLFLSRKQFTRFFVAKTIDPHNFKIRNDRMASQLQCKWKEMQEGAQFESTQMMGCKVDCNRCGMNCRTTHNFKIRK